MLYIFGLIVFIGISCIILWNKSSDWCYSNNTVKKWMYKYYYEYWVICISWALTVIMGASLIVCGIVGIYEETAKETIKQEYLAQYTILQYQIDIGINENYVEYDNTHTTYTDAIEYNKTIIKGRNFHDSFWLGWRCSDIYKDLPLIEIPGGKE